MDTLYLTKDVKLVRQDSTLFVIPHKGSRRRVPIEGLKHVIIAGEAQLTTAVLGLCGRHNVRVTILDWYGNVTGTFEPKGSPASGKIRLLQTSAALDPYKKMAIAQSFVLGAAYNIRANLKYRAYRGNHAIDAQLSSIQSIIDQIPAAENIESLMGLEGQIRAYYYEAWPLIDQRLDFGARRRRPPNNPLNCLIS